MVVKGKMAEKRRQRHLGKVKLCGCLLCRWKWIGRVPIAKRRLKAKAKDELRNFS